MKRKFLSITALTILVMSMFIGITAVPLAGRLFAQPVGVSNAVDPMAQAFFGDSGIETTTEASDPLAKLDSGLREYVMTGKAPDEIRTFEDRVYFVMGAETFTDFEALSEHMTVTQMAKVLGGYIVHGYVTSPKDLLKVDERIDTGILMSDQFLTFEQPRDDFDPTQYYVNELMRADLCNNITGTGAFTEVIDGTGVTIGIMDTGTDFGATDLSTSFATEGGVPTSFDAAGTGLAVSDWFGYATYGYLGTAGHDFEMWRGDSGYSLPLSLYGYEAEDTFVGDPTTGVPRTVGIPFAVGVTVQVGAGIPYSRMFFVWLLTSISGMGYDRLYVDWETSWAITADWAEIDAMGMTQEWDFTDNLGDYYEFDATHAVIATDFDGDGVNDFSMGSLANTLDTFGVVTGALVSGIDPSGLGFALMNDPSGHGTSTAHAAAGKGIVEYDVFGDGNLETLPGIAPGAEVMALKALTFGDWMWGWLWGSGFDPTPPASLWMPYHYARNWTYSGNHHCHMISNSWGGVVHETSAYNFVSGTEWYSWLIDYLTAYTGTLFLVGSNNAGIGYGTTTYPSSAATLSVGASTSYHIFQDLYDNNSNWVPGGDQIVYFSGNGPTWMGIPKPNVVAVGAGSFVPDAVGYGRGDGTTAFGIFSGTSLATPLTAGVAALVYQVAMSEGWLYGFSATGPTHPPWVADFSPDPYLVKTIIESTTVDLGYDPYRQGSGRVDAFRAVHAAYGNTTDGTDPILLAYSDSAWNNVAAGDRAGFSRGYYMGMRLGEAVYGNGFDYLFLGATWLAPEAFDDYYLTNFHPSFFGYPDYQNGLYMHNMFPGDWAVETITVEDFYGTGTATSWNAYEYTLLNESTTTMTSSSTYTTFALEDNFDAAFMAQFMAADYVEVFCTYGRDDFESLFNLASMSNYVFLHDWNDTNANGQIDLTSSAAAGEVRRISADISYGNNHKMCVGMPGNAFYADPASKGPTIYYHDVGVELFLWRTLDVDVTVRIYQKTAWTGVPIDVDLTSAGGNDWDVNVTVDATAMPGQYGGFIELLVGGNVATRMPVSVRVDGQVQGGNSMSWGGTTGRPYDNGATYGHIDWGNWGETAGDWRIYWVDVSYQVPTGDLNDFTSWVMVNVTWDDPDTVIDAYLYMSGYGNRAYFGPYSATDSGSTNIGDGQWQGEATWPGQNVLLADWTWDAYGGDAYWNYTDGYGYWYGDIWQNETFGYPPDNNNMWRIGDNHTASMSHRGYLGVALHTIHYGGDAAYENFTVTVNTALNSTIPSVRSETLFSPDFQSWDPYWTEWVPNGTYNPAWGAYNWTATAHDGLMSYFPGGAIQVTSHGNAPLTANSAWQGPQVEFQAGWNALTLLPFPTVSIRQTSLELLSGLEQENYGTIQEPVVGGWNPDLNPREAYDFVSLLAGQEVYVECEFGTWTDGEGSPLTHTAADDCDLFYWAPDTPHTYANSLTGATTATGANPEIGEFLAPVSGNYTIGIDWYSGVVPMGWRSYVRAAQATGITEDGQTCTMDTSITGTNAAYDVRARMITGTSLDDVTSFSTFMITNVTITNWFAPTLSLTTPNGGESYRYGVDTVLIQWTASDPNVDAGEEILGFSVEVSNGTLWKTVVFGTTATEATWDPADPYYGFPATSIGPNFLVRVNCTDGMYQVSATSAAVWEVFYLAPPPPPPWELITVVVVVVIVIIILLLTCLLKRRQTAAK